MSKICCDIKIVFVLFCGGYEKSFKIYQSNVNLSHNVQIIIIITNIIEFNDIRLDQKKTIHLMVEYSRQTRSLVATWALVELRRRQDVTRTFVSGGGRIGRSLTLSDDSGDSDG